MISKKSSTTTKPRTYQERIIRSAKNKNAIVVLPTGSGKTLIASALALHYHTGTFRTKTLFLVPTRLLVRQQAQSLSAETGLKVGEFHGGVSLPKEFDILVSTPEALRMDIAKSVGSFSFEMFALVVFDEVHHVMKKHPYRKVARLLEFLEGVERPYVLGLTATCTYAMQDSKIQANIEDLCAVLNISEILTASKEELIAAGYHGATPLPQVELLHDVFEPEQNQKTVLPNQIKEVFFDDIKHHRAHPFIMKIYAMTRSLEVYIKRIYPAFQSPMDEGKGKDGKVKNWSTYAVRTATLLRKSTVSKFCAALEHFYEALRLLIVTKSSALDLAHEYLCMTIMKDDLASLASIDKPFVNGLQTEWAVARQNVPQKRLVHLTNVLITQYNNKSTTTGNTFRGILFVEQRLTTHILQHFIERSLPLAPHFRIACIYATAGSATPSFSVSTGQSNDRLKQFGSGKLNLLISTAVTEEGMDVPSSNCVIRFDPVTTPVSLIQSRGRARQEESSFVVMKEMENRSIVQLLNAEMAQQKVLAASSNSEGNVVVKAQSQQRRDQGQASRERCGQMILQQFGSGGNVCYSNPVYMLNLYCQKTASELLEGYSKTNSGWCFTVTILGTNLKVQTTSTAPTKKESKTDACLKMIEKLRNAA